MTISGATWPTNWRSSPSLCFEHRQRSSSKARVSTIASTWPMPPKLSFAISKFSFLNFKRYTSSLEISVFNQRPCNSRCRDTMHMEMKEWTVQQKCTYHFLVSILQGVVEQAPLTSIECAGKLCARNFAWTVKYRLTYLHSQEQAKQSCPLTHVRSWLPNGQGVWSFPTIHKYVSGPPWLSYIALANRGTFNRRGGEIPGVKHTAISRTAKGPPCRLIICGLAIDLDPRLHNSGPVERLLHQRR